MKVDMDAVNADSHIVANLPKRPQSQQQKFPFRPKTSQYSERVKAVRRLQIQTSTELAAARQLCNNIESEDVHYHQSLGSHEFGKLTQKGTGIGHNSD